MCVVVLFLFGFICSSCFHLFPGRKFICFCLIVSFFSCSFNSLLVSLFACWSACYLWVDGLFAWFGEKGSCLFLFFIWIGFVCFFVGLFLYLLKIPSDVEATFVQDN